MQGTLSLYEPRDTDTIVHPPIVMNAPPTLDQLQSLMNSTSIFIVFNFASMTSPDGKSVIPCVAFADGSQPPGSANTAATRLWQMALMRMPGGGAWGGILNPSISTIPTPGWSPYLTNNINGSAVVATGDDDFLAACRALFPPITAPIDSPPATRSALAASSGLEFNEIGVIVRR